MAAGRRSLCEEWRGYKVAVAAGSVSPFLTLKVGIVVGVKWLLAAGPPSPLLSGKVAAGRRSLLSPEGREMAAVVFRQTGEEMNLW